MINRTLRRVQILLTVLLFAFGGPLAAAASVPLSGAYQVLRNSNDGSQTKVQLRLQFINHGPGSVVLQRILVWDFPHPPTFSSGRVSITLNSGSMAETTQEFVLPRWQFERWRKGVRPRIVLRLQTPGGATITQPIRLDRISTGKGE